MHLLESARFLIDVGRSYARSATLAAVANLGTAALVRAFLPTFHLSLLTRGGGFIIAGSLGGLIAVVEALVVVELSNLQQEAAGMALLFLPFVLAPTAVAALSWLFAAASTSSSGGRALALVGAIVGAVVASPLTPILFEHAKLLSAPSSSYILWMLLGIPLGAGATFGCVVVPRR